MEKGKVNSLTWLVLLVICSVLMVVVLVGEPILRQAARPSDDPGQEVETGTTQYVQPSSTAEASLGSTPVEKSPTVTRSSTSLARGYLTTPQELESIARKAADGIEPYKSAVAAELAFADKVLGRPALQPPDLIDIRSNAVSEPEYLYFGSRYAYAWAIAYHLLREHDPKRAEGYAEQAYQTIIAMPLRKTPISGYQKNTRLNISVSMQTFVFAADLLADWHIPGGTQPFGNSQEAQVFKTWLGEVVIRYPYNAAHTRVNNWGDWGRLTTAVIADYVGDAAPLYVQGMVKTSDGAYDVDRDFPCEASGVDTCRRVGAGAMYAAAIRLHLDKVDGNMVEDSSTSCDSSGSKSMIRPDGGIPDELRRFYDCDTVDIPVGADNDAVNYSQFAIEAMTCLAELAWRRGDPSIYTHIDPATGRGALFRAVGFLFDNDVRFKNGSKLEMINRFFTYQLAVERDPGRREEYNKLLGHDLPGRIKRDDEWPVGASFVSFGTLTHGFSTGEVLQPPPSVPPRPVVP